MPTCLFIGVLQTVWNVLLQKRIVRIKLDIDMAIKPFSCYYKLVSKDLTGNKYARSNY